LGVFAIVGFHDGLFTGIRSTGQQTVTLWVETTHGNGFQIILPGVQRVRVANFEGSHYIGSIILSEARVAPQFTFELLWPFGASNNKAWLKDQFESFRKSRGFLIEFGADAANVVAQCDGLISDVAIVKC
jgi:hypothetical protein